MAERSKHGFAKPGASKQRHRGSNPLPTAMDEIQWSAPEYHYYHKDVSWYWLVIIVGIILIGIAVWQKNFLFAVFIVPAAALTFFWGGREPKTISFTLNARGLNLDGKKFYPLESLEGFAIVADYRDPELSELMLKTKQRFNTWLTVITASERADQIKELLKKHLPEIEYRRSLTEHIGKILKF